MAVAHELSQLNQLFARLAIRQPGDIQRFNLLRLCGSSQCRQRSLEAIVETKLKDELWVLVADSSSEVKGQHLFVLAAYFPSPIRIFACDAVLQLLCFKETCFSPAIKLRALVIGLVVLSQERVSIFVDVVGDLSMVLVLILLFKIFFCLLSLFNLFVLVFLLLAGAVVDVVAGACTSCQLNIWILFLSFKALASWYILELKQGAVLCHS